MTVRRHIRIHAAHNGTGPAALPTPPAWMRDALCAQTDSECFYPAKGESDIVRAAKAVCSRCPVTADCLEYALANDEHWGIWGGKTNRELRRIRHERRAS